MFKKALILAGGEGSRMRPLTKYVPKPLVVVEERCLIDHVINFLHDNYIEDITVTYGYKGSMLVEHVAKDVEAFINTQGKDNSYFLYNSLIAHLDEPIVVCPCDMITNLDLNKVYGEYERLGKPAGCIVPVQTTLDADSLMVEDSRVKSIERGNRTGLYASGIQILNPQMINKLTPKADNFYKVWSNLIKVNQLYATSIMPTQWKIYDCLKDLP